MKYGGSFDPIEGFAGSENSRDDAIYEQIAGRLEDAKVGDEIEVWTCLCAFQDAGHYLPHVSSIVDMMAENAAEDCGEYAEGWPYVQAEGEIALQKMLIHWAKEHCDKPKFYTPVAVQKHVVTVGRDAIGRGYVEKMSNTEVELPGAKPNLPKFLAAQEAL